MPATDTTTTPRMHQLNFRCLIKEGHSMRFPCDEAGVVDIDSLNERARNNYLMARAAVGRDYARPIVE